MQRTPDQAVKLFEIQAEQVGQAHAAQTAHEAFAKGIGWRGPRGYCQDFDTAGSRRKVRSEFAIPITDQVFGLLISGGGCPQLLSHPLVSGISGNSCMHNPTGVQFHDHEAVNGSKEQNINHCEITGPEVLEMILEKCGPDLA